MFIELLEFFRCSRAHEESWLVAALHDVRGRVILSGQLGCPICGARYTIRDGVLEMGTDQPPPAQPAEQDPWRTAALLDLQPAAGVAVLEGAAAMVAEPLLEIFPGSLIVVNPPFQLEARERLAIVRSIEGLPLRSASVSGVAAAAPQAVADAPRVLRPGGRLLAPVAAIVPQHMREIARDAQHWVAVNDSGEIAIRLSRR